MWRCPCRESRRCNERWGPSCHFHVVVDDDPDVEVLDVDEGDQVLWPEDEEEEGRVEGDVVLEDPVADDLVRALEVRAVPAVEEALEMERQMVLGASGSPLLPVASSDLLVNKRPPPPLELTEVEDQMGVRGATTTGVPVYKSPPVVLPKPVYVPNPP